MTQVTTVFRAPQNDGLMSVTEVFVCPRSCFLFSEHFLRESCPLSELTEPCIEPGASALSYITSKCIYMYLCLSVYVHGCNGTDLCNSLVDLHQRILFNRFNWSLKMITIELIDWINSIQWYGNYYIIIFIILM